MSNTRTIHTGLYGANLRHTIPALWGQVVYEHGCKASTFKTRSTRATTIDVADDNELLINLGELYDRKTWHDVVAFNGWTDVEIFDHIAWNLKQLIVKAIKEKGGAEWKRSCTDSVELYVRDNNSDLGRKKLSVPVNEVYFVYDFLKGRKVDKRYDAETNAKLVAQPLDPISTEMKIAQKQEIAKLKEQLEVELRRLDGERYKRIEEARTAIYKEVDALKDAARKCCDAKIKEIEELLDAPMAALLTGAELGA